MNKKIKVIELLNKIANGEDLPKRIKIQDYVFELSKDYEHYYYNEDVEITHLINHNFSNLNDEVEILEDNTEEIEEIKEISDEYFNMLSDEAKVKWLKSYIKEDRNKINELVKVVKEIRKDLNK